MFLSPYFQSQSPSIYGPMGDPSYAASQGPSLGAIMAQHPQRPSGVTVAAAPPPMQHAPQSSSPLTSLASPIVQQGLSSALGTYGASALPAGTAAGGAGLSAPITATTQGGTGILGAIHSGLASTGLAAPMATSGQIGAANALADGTYAGADFSAMPAASTFMPAATTTAGTAATGAGAGLAGSATGSGLLAGDAAAAGAADAFGGAALGDAAATAAAGTAAAGTAAAGTAAAGTAAAAGGGASAGWLAALLALL